MSGSVPLQDMVIGADEDGASVEWREGKEYPRQENYSLCRCGKSKNKPFCDGSHIKKFKCKETASHQSYREQASKIEGPGLILMDAPDLCAFARFCDRGDGVWAYTRGSDDPEAKRIAKEEAYNCPSGRLVAFDPDTNKPYEVQFPESIGVVEDPQMGCNGPLWVRGGIPVEGVDGKTYEVRNRVTLCRCGKSGNMPFCDGRHAG